MSFWAPPIEIQFRKSGRRSPGILGSGTPHKSSRQARSSIAVALRFTIFDILWVGLAVVTAFKMGAGMQIVPETLSDSVEDPPTP